MHLPSKSEIIRQVEEPGKPIKGKEGQRHMPVIEKPSRSFSIKEVITDNERKPAEPAPQKSESIERATTEKKVELNEDSLRSAWKEFVESIKCEGPRVISMFKTIRPELEDDHSVKIHLTNAAQKDLFVQNYRQKLYGYMESKFLVSELDIEAFVDLSETNELLYTDEQKYNYLLAKYPVLKDFKKTFNLDIP